MASPKHLIAQKETSQKDGPFSSSGLFLFLGIDVSWNIAATLQ